MITRKALFAKLDEMDRSYVLVSQKDYRNSHPLFATPLQRVLCQLVGARSVGSLTYTTQNGMEHASPTWLIRGYRRLAFMVHSGMDIDVRAMISVIDW